MNSIINHFGRANGKGLKLVYEEFILGGNSLINKSWDFDTPPSMFSISSILEFGGGYCIQSFSDITLAQEYNLSGIDMYDYRYILNKFSNSLRYPNVSFDSTYTKITLNWEGSQPPRNHIMFYA